MAQGYRRQFLERLQSGEKLDESEILNIILSNAYGGRDMSAVATALLERFPSITAVIKADYAEIKAVRGVSDSVAAYLKTLGLTENFGKSDELYIDSTAQCFDMAAERFRGKKYESMEIYFLNRSGKVTDIKSYTSELPDKVEVAAGTLFLDISTSNAYALYVAHNHLNSSAKPSKDDNEVTAKIIEACKICKIIFCDHCILSSNGERFSYAESGTIPDLKN
ncbi:MAG: hypothetical protein K2K04_01545 [Clostridia bacterium]|nr:hypothetical protein [Clostridia bacterium]